MYAIYMVTFTIKISPMLAYIYILYMDPLGEKPIETLEKLEDDELLHSLPLTLP